MGLNETKALTLARRIAVFNSEAIFYIKNSLMKMTPSLLKMLKGEHEKFTILIKSSYPKVIIKTVLANVDNNNNHDLMKLDVDLIYDALTEGENESSN